MHPADIQAQLKKRNIYQQEIADELGVSSFHVSAVIRKQRPSDRVMRAVAAKIGKSPYELFPEFYGPRKNRRKPFLG